VGGGNQILNNYGYVVGIDLSISSLLNAKRIYREVYHCSASSLPFEDETFDIVFSNQLLGHIPPGMKDKVIEEIYRVTKTGGFSIHTIECDSNAAYFKWAKRYPQLFRKYFIDMYGHYGLELPTENFRRFRAAGFKPIREIAVPSKGYVREIASYSIMFDNEYKSYSKIISILAPIATIIKKNKVVAGVTNILLGFTIPICNFVTPKDHRDSADVLYQK
jgi:SAM-dependent methyltransferase